MVYDDTIEIFTLWDRVKKRFNIVRPQPKSFTLMDTLQPVTNVDNILGAPKAYSGALAVAGNGNRYLTEVPLGKRWELSLSYVLTVGAGTFDVDRFIMTDKLGSAITPYDIFTNTTEHLLLHPHPLVLTSEMPIGVRIANFAGAGDITFRYWVTETDIEE